jgi:hypothetical protein
MEHVQVMSDTSYRLQDYQSITSVPARTTQSTLLVLTDHIPSCLVLRWRHWGHWPPTSVSA